jgi:hypothetical protein
MEEECCSSLSIRLFIFYGFHCIDLAGFVRYRKQVHADTEVRIQQLCTEAIAASTQADADRMPRTSLRC